MILLIKKRTYRDYEQFSELIDDHISNIEHINSNEKIYLLYLYHFYYEVYNKVISFIDRDRISFLEVLKSYKSTEDEKNENFMDELQKKYQLDNLLYPFINNKDVNSPSLFGGDHDLYIIGNGKSFHNIKLVLEHSKGLFAESFKEVTELDSQSQALFRNKVFRLIVMHQDDKKLLIGYLDDIVNLLFDNNQYNEDTDFNNLIAATLYDLKKFLITTSEFKEWYKHKADTIGLNKLFFLKVKFDRENNVLTDEEYESIVQSKEIICNDEPFYGTLHLLKDYNKKRFSELIRDIIDSDDGKFYEETKLRLLTTITRNGKEKIPMVHETIISSPKLKGEFLSRIKIIEHTQLRGELLSYYDNALDYSGLSSRNYR